MNKIEEKTQELAEMLGNKAKKYGNSYEILPDLLKIFFPEGIKVEQYSDVIFYTRILDVMIRRANGNYPDAFKFISGYATVQQISEEEKNENGIN